MQHIDDATEALNSWRRIWQAHGEVEVRSDAAAVHAGSVGWRFYGDFITPAGFGTEFGECNIPAPGLHGYEQRAYYIGKEDADNGKLMTLICHNAGKFDKPWDAIDTLVPVIVTVLR